MFLKETFACNFLVFFFYIANEYLLFNNKLLIGYRITKLTGVYILGPIHFLIYILNGTFMTNEFRTTIQLKERKEQISYQSSIFFIGSCFSDSIGNLLTQKKFTTKVNPFGVLYNPISIATMLERVLTKQYFTEDDFFIDQNVWKSFELHSSFSSTDLTALIKRANHEIDQSYEFLKNCSHLVLTWGTSYVYMHNTLGLYVSNCHKVPSREFSRERMTQELLMSVWENTIYLIRRLNPKIKIILTVSPIRHWKDGAHENQLSKAILLLTQEQLQNKFSECIGYFPSYEIILDDLRDYRFYAEDMIHISNQAINYVYQKLEDAYFSKQTSEIVKHVEKVNSAYQHRFLTNDVEEIKRFAKQSIAKIENIERQHPNIDFGTEKNYFKNL